MTTKQEGPPPRATRADPDSEGDTSPTKDDVPNSLADPKATIRPDDRFRANLIRMARRAAGDRSFYEISGSTVQRLADELRSSGGDAA
jgi:hypothetical protein